MTRQYFYKDNGCPADDNEQPDCTCWHDVGTGPCPDAREGRCSLCWRDKPAPPWHATEMPNDALDPASYVGRMLNAEPVAPVADAAELPLWLLFGCWSGLHKDLIALLLDDIRDRLLPPEPAVISDSAPDDPIWARFNERQRLRAILTNQARIAREGC